MESEGTPVVPAQRLLDVAAALADGAARMHAQLRDLDPARRDALLELMTGQIASMVGLWAELVRGVVDVELPASGTATAPAPAGRSERLAPVADRWEPEPAPSPPPPEIRVVPDEPASGAHRRHSAPPPPAAGDEAERLTRDELTGVLNRPTGMAALHREIERSRQSATRFVLGYLNVDGLRYVNETQGPRAGDELLRKVTAALRATLRSYDVILRLGGDEFLFSLPGADMATAEQRLREFDVILGEEAPGASASVGFAELREGDALDDLIARADHALVAGRRPRRRSR
jgi:diguanylate cyclase (GGDEF)-like protein